jgi:hypothetical protein
VSDAIAATQVIYEERDGDSLRSVEYLVSAQRVLARSAQGTDVAIYDRADDSLWLLQDGDGVLSPLARSDLQTLADRLGEGLDSLEARWGELPPEQAARARADFDRLLGPKPARGIADAAFASGEHGSYAGLTCTWHRLEASGQPLGRACLADGPVFPFDATLLAMLRLVAGAFTAVGEAGSGALGNTALGSPLLPEALLTGLPLAVAIVDDRGVEQRALQLRSVAPARLRAERFALPTARRRDPSGT